MDVSENSGFSPQIIHFNRVFHDFHHPFWGFSPYFWEAPISPMPACDWSAWMWLLQNGLQSLPQKASKQGPIDFRGRQGECHSEVARTCCVRWYVRPSRFAKKKLTSYIEHWKKLLAFLLCLKKVGQSGPCWVCWGSSFLDQNQLTNIAPGSNEAPPPWQIGAVEYHPWTILGSTNHFVSRNMSCYFNYFYFVHRIISDRSKKNTPWSPTPRKLNMEPEDVSLEKKNHLPNHHFEVLC